MSESRPPETRESPLIRRQQWTSAGLSSSEMRSRLRSGRYERIYAGVYRAVGEIPPRHTEVDRTQTDSTQTDRTQTDRTEVRRERDLIRAVAGRSKALVVSDRSAGVMHGLALEPKREPGVWLTRNARSGGNRNGIRQVRARPLRDDEIVRVGGLRVTSVARTLLDLSCSLECPWAVAAIDDALRRRLVEPVELAQSLAGAHRRIGAQAARRAFALADGRAESVGETFLRLIVKQLGLPEPDLQVEVRGSRGEFLARVDMAFPDLGLIIEFDGKSKYTAHLRPGQSVADAVIEEKDRENRLLECGYVVIRVIWRDLYHPEELAARIRQAMVRGRRSIAAGLIVGSMVVPDPVRIPMG
jgi:hypothetical protein